MKAKVIAALAVAALPALASAQYVYGPSVTRYGYSCSDRDAALLDRGMWLDSRKREIDRDGADLANELRNLDNRDVGAVASYNARSAEHNRRVAELNAGVAQYNTDMREMVDGCNFVYYAPRSGDVIIWERSTIR
jgi:hypothetical protein